MTDTVQNIAQPLTGDNSKNEDGPTIQDNTKTEDTTPQKPVEGTKPEEDGGLSEAEYKKFATRLADIVDRGLEKVEPILGMITEHLDKAADKPKDEVDEEKLVDNVKPLIEQASGILNDVLGQIKGVDPSGEIQNKAKRNAQDHKATGEEQRLAEGLTKLTEKVTKTIENAKNKLKGMPHAEDKLGPLLSMLSDPLFQILSGVGMLLNGVLTLVGNLLNGLGLGGILNGLLNGLGLNKLLGSLGLGSLGKALGGENKKKKT
jgi:hypothetical protein